MKRRSIKDRVAESLKNFKLPLWAKITITAIPAILILLFYVLRSNSAAMGWAQRSVAAPIRVFLGRISSAYPLSLMEILIIIAIVWVIYYIIKTIRLSSRRSDKLIIISRRLIIFVTVLMYIWSMQIWLWNSGYFAPGFAERNGFRRQGVTAAQLADVTRHFARRANELAPQVRRDETGRVIEDRGELFDVSVYVFNNIAEEFPCLDGRLFRPKPMLFSRLMSRTGYTGVFFAITGEANINTRMPIFLMPTTIAHEHAHMLGVFAEDEANFVAVLASITSGIPAFKYAGYLFGLMHLMRPLSTADPEAWREINESLSREVSHDWQENFEFWQSQRTVDTGIGFVDTALTNLGRVTRETVNNVYDSFLRANRQELGLQSYGAVVDLLVEYFSR